MRKGNSERTAQVATHGYGFQPCAVPRTLCVLFTVALSLTSASACTVSTYYQGEDGHRVRVASLGGETTVASDAAGYQFSADDTDSLNKVADIVARQLLTAELLNAAGDAARELNLGGLLE